ncbi:GCN5 family acetyltransferase [Paenibacillus ferrarius]|uniref:GCN5 family acetyltransferase n=1 Tax=Paenibacillus ferrarius TaxID=1469647 RepID=A0A1V4H8A8_9BACL|nr:GNAT family protein [Paenibacillus ferrarius]OPH47337.1 GCN5 family acetyltransferase [Paenibacillus ferrarius]
MTCKGEGQLTEIQIEGSDILLRFARESDLEEYFTFIQDTEINRLTGSQREFTRDEIATCIRKISVQNNDRVDFMIVFKGINELLGEVVLNEIDSINLSANIRIGIQGTQHRGKGYGTEAMIHMLHMLRYGFNILKLHRIHLGVYTFNPRAIHVYEKIGFKREGVQRDSLYIDGKFHDMITMAILEDEFRLLHDSLH